MAKKNRKWYDSDKLDEKATRNYEKLEEEAVKIIQEKNKKCKV